MSVGTMASSFPVSSGDPSSGGTCCMSKQKKTQIEDQPTSPVRQGKNWSIQDQNTFTRDWLRLQKHRIAGRDGWMDRMAVKLEKSGFHNYLCAMATVMEHHQVSRLQASNQLLQRGADVSSSRLNTWGIGVEHHEDVRLVESESSDERLLHALHIIGASVKLHFCAGVAAPHE